MQKLLITLFVIHYSLLTITAQNKYGNTWVIGQFGDQAMFDGSTNKPVVRNNPNILTQYTEFLNGTSNICDPSTGKILFMCNGAQLYDTMGVLLNNGDHLIPNNQYYSNIFPGASNSMTQNSIILPKGNNQYYVFTPCMSDALYNTQFALGKYQYDLMRYNVVDMSANNSAGKVIVKNKDLMTTNLLNLVGMQACRHANGIDWWLLKNGGPNNVIYTFLVKADTIMPPIIQSFNAPLWDSNATRFGQAAFSKDGTRYAYCTGWKDSFFMADFNRFTGMLSNPKVIQSPLDYKTIQWLDDTIDYVNTGIAFSENGRFIYKAHYENIYQYDLQEPNPTQAWFTVKHGWDTSAFMGYYGLYNAPDGKIYIGKFSGGTKVLSVINNPNAKGVACNFCPKCLRNDTSPIGLQSPPNMPDYNLGPIYPNAVSPIALVQGSLLVYPNPTTCILNVEGNFSNNTKIQIYNNVGQEVNCKQFKIHNSKFLIQTANLPNGMYYIKTQNAVAKFLKE